MGLDEEFETINYNEAFPVLIVYAIVMFISIVIYKKWYKRYKSIPDKTVEARLIKTSDYFGDGETNDGLPSTASYIIAKYEYYINNKRHTVKTKCFGSVPESITLYYKKGNWDVRGEKEFSLPYWLSALMIAYFTAGVALITVFISWLLKLDFVMNKLS